jgi:glycosyltransferase involved in cell wall biosynthesis
MQYVEGYEGRMDDNKMINVLHINSNYLTSKLHENLLDRVATDNLRHTVFMPIKEDKKEEFLYQSKHEVYCPISFKDRDKYFFIWKQAKIYNQLRKRLNLEQFQITHAHTLFTDGNLAYRLYKEYNIPYIVTVRGYTDIDSFFKYRINLRRRGREILRHAKKIIFLSESNRKQLLERYIKDKELKEEILEKSTIKPNGIDDFWFENEGERKSLANSNSLKCITVGKIMKRKNLLGTINALKIVEKEYQVNIKLMIVGKEWDMDYVQKVKKELTIDHTIHPETSKENLLHLYRENDLFILPSFQETFGLVYPEAMSQGLPVIYTKNQGFDQQFSNGEVGYAVEATNPQDIAENVMQAIENYDDLSSRALKRYKKFDWNELSKEYRQYYEQFAKRFRDA